MTIFYATVCKYFFRIVRCLAVTAAALSVGLASPAHGQETGGPPDRIAVFLDCQRCNETFIRQEMTVVDHVRDRQQAHVHVLVTEQNTGGGGELMTFDLIGLGPFEGQDFSTTYTVASSATQAEERDGFLRTLRVALVPYLMQTSMADRMALEIEGEVDEQSRTQQAEDPWNNWVFEVYGNGFGDKEASQHSIRLFYGLEAEHVSEDWKVQIQPNFQYSYDYFERGDETITSTAREDGLESYAVRSISPHWSVGMFADAVRSTFNNYDLRARLQPAIEYSVFPYSEFTRRQLTFSYRAGGSYANYDEVTIFDKLKQTLPQHAVAANYELTQPWGEAEIGLEASQYLHDVEKYGVEFDAEVEVRLTEGLSVEFGGTAELIHDQLNLRRGGASLDEVLLRRRELATNYELSFQVGFNYQFGSIYNNVVNPRFSGGGGGGFN